MAKPYVAYEGPIVTRAEARAQGLARYFTGNPCRRGHLSQRLVSSQNCVTCHLLNGHSYAKAHPEKGAVRQQRYRQAHPERPLAYRKANKEKIATRSRAYKEANPERVREDTRRWFAANPGVVQRWRKANPEAWRAQVQTRHARMANAEGRHTAAELKALLKAQNSRCGYCRKLIATTYTVDHIQPLSRGGTNWISNIQLLCLSCNTSKQDADPIDFARRLGRLV